MAGAMRKMGIYLGLVEEDDRHPDDPAYAENDSQSYGGESYGGESYATQSHATQSHGAQTSGAYAASDRSHGSYAAPASHPEFYGGESAAPARRPRAERASRVWSGGPEQHRPVEVHASRQGATVSASAEPASYRITTLHPRTYNEARTIGEHFRDGVPVIMNLTEMDDSDAKRLVDFAAGLSFGLRGSIERVTNKVFLLSPQNVSVTAEDKARIAEGGFFNQS